LLISLWKFAKKRIITESFLILLNLLVWFIKGLGEEILFSNIVQYLFGSIQADKLDILRLIFSAWLTIIIVLIAIWIWLDVRDKNQAIKAGKKELPILRDIRNSFNQYETGLREVTEKTKQLSLDNYITQYLYNNAEYLQLVSSGKTKNEAALKAIVHMNINPHLEYLLRSSLTDKRNLFIQKLISLKYPHIYNKKLIKIINEFCEHIIHDLDHMVDAGSKEIKRELLRKYSTAIDTATRNMLSQYDTESDTAWSKTSGYILDMLNRLEDYFRGK